MFCIFASAENFLFTQARTENEWEAQFSTRANLKFRWSKRHTVRKESRDTALVFMRLGLYTYTQFKKNEQYIWYF